MQVSACIIQAKIKEVYESLEVLLQNFILDVLYGIPTNHGLLDFLTIKWFQDGSYNCS